MVGIPLRRRDKKTTWALGSWEQKKVVFAKPQTFMNLSGEAVNRLADFFSINRQRIIVIHDDLDLELGRIKIREKGGDGGHRGVRSIIDHLESKEFLRIRMGIGRKSTSGAERDYVLDVFDDEQKQVVTELVETACEAVRTIVFEGAAAAMNRFNQKNHSLS